MDRGRFRKFSPWVMVVTILLLGVAQGHARPLTVPGGQPDYFETPNWANSPPLRKFVDTLPGLESANNLGQKITVAVADNTTYPGSDYYEIVLVQYREKMHSDLPPTLLREYVQRSTSVVPGAHVALSNANRDGTTTPILINGSQAYGVDNVHYLGPLIIAQKDRPVRVRFINALPSGSGGDLFLPVDNTIMGSGMFEIDYDPVTKDSIPMITGTFAQNRATLHLHGGRTPWISDGTPHQWTVPADEITPYAKGVSVSYVPDMWFDVDGNTITSCAGATTCGVSGATNDPGPGQLTFYWTNQQSGRLMFYHDHAWGITRLNVYVGEAAGYLIQDNVELALVNGGTVGGRTFNAGTIPSAMIPLVIQDKTYVDNATIAGETGTDPTWNWGSTPGTPQTGDLWWPHVYMPAENPFNPDMTGMNQYGRWFYGPWFYPPTPLCGSSPTAVAPYCITQGPVPNYYYVNDPYCSPVETELCTQPPEMPGTPNVSWGAEAFLDTMVVNGTAYPSLEVQPQAYRFRILNAAHDRFLNLQLYVADNTYVPTDNGYLKEVKMVPSAVREACSATVTTNCVCTATDAPAGCFPDTWPADGREGGVPDPAYRGPAWIQIGTEGGFLPTPVLLPNQPVSWNYDPTTFNFGNVNGGTLLLGPAERADVIVDFTRFAGQTLILYNDAPTAFPALVPQYNYYTGAPDRTDMGGVAGTPPGFGPNVRTVMQVKVAGSGGTAPVDDYNAATLTALDNAFRSSTGSPSAFELGQSQILVGQTAYNSTYNKTFPARWPNWGVSRITDNTISFQTVDGTTMSNFVMKPKAIHDEMGGSFDELGRMAAKLGLEVFSPSAANANFILQNYVDPPTEKPESGEIQVWKITHNGVDSHPIHFHLFDVQVLNRVGWDGIIRLPDANELGWKDTVRISPLEDTIVAVRAALPTVPFALPNSVRPLNPMTPLETEMGFSQINTTDGGALTTPMTNRMYDFGHEYVWHCHILSHEENDMMRSISVQIPLEAPIVPDNLVATATGTGNSRIILTWRDNSSNEIGFRIQRSTGGAYDNVATMYPNITTYSDTALAQNTTYTYRVVAFNTVGDSEPSNTASATSGTFPAATSVTLVSNPASPQNIGTLVSWVAAASGGTGYYEYQFQYRPAGTTSWLTGQAFSTNGTWRWDTTTTPGGNYEIRVSARTVGTVAAVSATATYALTGGTGPATSVALISTPASPQVPGTLVTFTAAASGGSGNYQYQFWLYANGSWSVKQAYSSINSWTWSTTGYAIGSYTVVVYARAAGTSVAYDVYKSATYTLGTPPATSVAFTPPPSPASPQSPGASVIFRAIASGGSGTYEYKFLLWNGATWSVMKDYTVPGNTWTWNTTGYALGNYSVAVYARNAGSPAALDTFTSTAYTLVSPASSVAFIPAPSPASPQVPGTSVTFTAAASGGTGTYEYQFWLYANGAWSIKQGYSSSNSWTWTTTGFAPGSYTVLVYARNAGSVAPRDTYKSVTYTLVSVLPASSVAFSPPPSPASPQSPGALVTFTASASGGSGTYEYKFWLWNGATWTVMKDYLVPAGDSWAWDTTGYAFGTYTVAVYARNAGSSAALETYTSTPYTLR